MAIPHLQLPDDCSHSHDCQLCEAEFVCTGYLERDDESGRVRCQTFSDDGGDLCPKCVKAHSDEYDALTQGPDGYR